VLALAIQPSGTTLYAGSQGNGVFELDIGPTA
jgi:hypothetical protein